MPKSIELQAEAIPGSVTAKGCLLSRGGLLIGCYVPGRCALFAGYISTYKVFEICGAKVKSK